MNLITPTPEQSAAVANAYDGGYHPFWSLREMDKQNRADLHTWVDKDELVPIVDDSTGGIIGYIHEKHVDRIVSLLNVVTL